MSGIPWLCRYGHTTSVPFAALPDSDTTQWRRCSRCGFIQVAIKENEISDGDQGKRDE